MPVLARPSRACSCCSPRHLRPTSTRQPDPQGLRRRRRARTATYAPVGATSTRASTCRPTSPSTPTARTSCAARARRRPRRGRRRQRRRVQRRRQCRGGDGRRSARPRRDRRTTSTRQALLQRPLSGRQPVSIDGGEHRPTARPAEHRRRAAAAGRSARRVILLSFAGGTLPSPPSASASRGSSARFKRLVRPRRGRRRPSRPPRLRPPALPAVADRLSAEAGVASASPRVLAALAFYAQGGVAAGPTTSRRSCSSPPALCAARPRCAARRARPHRADAARPLARRSACSRC